jgi:hypothetical protein
VTTSEVEHQVLVPGVIVGSWPESVFDGWQTVQIRLYPIEEADDWFWLQMRTEGRDGDQ